MTRLRRSLFVALLAVLQLVVLPAASVAGCALLAGEGDGCCCAAYGAEVDEPPVASAHGSCCGAPAPETPAPAEEPADPCACVVAPHGDPATTPEAPAGLERPVLAPLAWAAAPVLASAGARPAVRGARGALPGDRPPRWLVLQVVRR